MTELEIDLTQQVEKLNGRLSKAAQVFKTQKADIERMTSERDEAQAEVDKLKSKIKELEQRISENSQTEETMMEQSEQLSQLETELSKTKSSFQEEVEKTNSLKDELDKEIALKDDLRAKLDEANKNHEEETTGLRNTIMTFENEKEEIKNMVAELFNNFKVSAKSVSKLSKFMNLSD